jgi:predicted CXXCH cytochrome family protein
MSASALASRRLVFTAAVLAAALLPGCSTGNAPRPSESARLGRAFAANAVTDRRPLLPPRQSLLSASRQLPLAQSRRGESLLVDDMSGEKPAEGKEGDKGADAVSGATAANESHDAGACLTCHGPFEELAKKVTEYVNEWDEKVNPHVHVPHDSTTVVECTECHDPHKVPFEMPPDARKPDVQFCYSCHHEKNFEKCSKCHPK